MGWAGPQPAQTLLAVPNATTQGHSKSLKMVPFESLVILVTCRSNYGHIFSHFGDIQRQRYPLDIWQKIAP